MAKKKSTVGKDVERAVKSVAKEMEGCCSEGKCCSKSCCKPKSGCNTWSVVYFFGFVGAAVYYLSTAAGFWSGVWGVIKALLWPAFLVFETLRYLGA